MLYSFCTLSSASLCWAHAQLQRQAWPTKGRLAVCKQLGYLKLHLQLFRVYPHRMRLGVPKRSSKNSTQRHIWQLLSLLLWTLNPQANYTDRVTANCRQSYCQFLRADRCRVISATDPHDRQNRYSRSKSIFFSFSYLFSYPHVAEWTPFQSRLLLKKSGRYENRTRDLWFVARNSDH
jgi:hypothetical protein